MILFSFGVVVSGWVKGRSSLGWTVWVGGGKNALKA